MAYLLGSKIQFMAREDTEKFDPSNRFHGPNKDELKFEDSINNTSNFSFATEYLQFDPDVDNIPKFTSEDNNLEVAQSVITQGKMLGKNIKNPNVVVALVKKLNIEFVGKTDYTLLKKSKLCYLNELFLAYIYDRLKWVLEPVSSITVDGVKKMYNNLTALDI